MHFACKLYLPTQTLPEPITEFNFHQLKAPKGDELPHKGPNCLC